MQQIFKRFGITDIVIPKETDDTEIDTSGQAPYFVGYELEDGTECDEEGNPLWI